MIAAPLISVVALTRDRPQEFRNLLQALLLQRTRDFEVVVVGAEPSAEDHGAPPALARRLTYAQCVDQNISLSRNIGLALSRGEYVAFIDDDAAPEPDWLTRLIPPFEDGDVGAVGGFVRGRNGIDYQWRGALVDRYGAHQALTARDLLVPAGAKEATTREAFVSTVGVNGAFRRSALEAIGGFDENLHYFLDESDVCIRLQKTGWRTVLAPEAEVHHAYAESSERRANRAPRDLFQIAASRVYFSCIYGDPDWQDDKLEQFRDDQDSRLQKFVQLGRLSRRQARVIMDRLDDGLIEGEIRFRGGRRLGASHSDVPRIEAEASFRPAEPERRPRVALVVAGLARRAVTAAARRLVEKGCEVTVIDFELRAKRLRVYFEDGRWLHVGGVLGRDKFDASMPTPRRCLRVKRELARIAPRRDFDVVFRPGARKYRIGEMLPLPCEGRLRGYVAEPQRAGGAHAALRMLTEDAARR